MAEPRFPIGQPITLPGHFAEPVLLESVRAVGEDLECTVRLTDGRLDKAIVARDDVAFLTVNGPGFTECGNASTGETLPLASDRSPVTDGQGNGQETALRTAGIPPRSPTGRLPRFLGEYEILEKIAEGGMGIVCKAYENKLHRFVALKVIRSGALAGAEDLRRFRQEAEVIAAFDHPHIIKIYGIGQEDDQPYFSMMFIEGGNLSRHIPRLKNDPDAAAALMAKVARAVHYAHQRTILHRDIKPSNILIDEHDDPYVTDFGLAKRLGIDNSTAPTVTGAVMGTPAYMPPEQAQGGAKSVTTSADVYGLGATLYETLTGRAPFSGDSVAEIIRQVLEQEPVRPRSINPALDRDLETICLKCLEKQPARRYGTAEALAEDLDRWRTGMPITARPVSTWEKAVKWVKRKPAVAALVTTVPVALLGLIGGGLWFTLELLKERKIANLALYSAGINLARRSLDDGLIYQTRQQLKSYETGLRGLGDLRSFEWYYLANLCDRTPIRLRGHEKAVICVAFHGDGNRVVSGGTDGTVRLWDLAERRQIEVFKGAKGSVHCVAFSPDGRWLAAGDDGGNLRLWELETRRERVLSGHHTGLRSVTFSPDNLHLLSAEADGLILQWDVATGEIDFPIWHGDQNERHASIANSNSKPTSGGTNSTYAPVDQMKVFGGTLASYTPDGKSIVTVGMDHWVTIWDVATRQKRGQARAEANIMGISIHPDGRQVALAEESPRIEIIDPTQPQGPRRVLRGPGPSYRAGTVVFSPVLDRRTLATTGHGASGLLDVDKDRILDLFGEQINYSPFSMAFGPEGHMLAMAVKDEVCVVRLDPSLQGATVASKLGPIRRLAASSDERLLALGLEDGKIVVWDVLANRALQILSGHSLGVFGLAFVPRPSGAWLASVGGDGLIQIWDAEAGGQPLRTLRSAGTVLGPSSAVLAVAVRPDGHQIATGAADGLVRTWNPVTGQPDLLPLDHGASISALAYDPSGTALASGGMDSTVRVWSATSGRRRLGPLSHKRQVTSLAFSPDGQLLAGGGNTTDMGGRIEVWDASSGTNSGAVVCPRGVNSLSFSSDSRRIATCGSDAVVQVWDATGGHETLSLDGGGERVSAVLFTSLKGHLYSAGLDGVVKRWDGNKTAIPK